jgi:hypothetical protein
MRKKEKLKLLAFTLILSIIAVVVCYYAPVSNSQLYLKFVFDGMNDPNAIIQISGVDEPPTFRLLDSGYGTCTFISLEKVSSNFFQCKITLHAGNSATLTFDVPQSSAHSFDASKHYSTFNHPLWADVMTITIYEFIEDGQGTATWSNNGEYKVSYELSDDFL